MTTKLLLYWSYIAITLLLLHCRKMLPLLLLHCFCLALLAQNVAIAASLLLLVTTSVLPLRHSGDCIATSERSLPVSGNCYCCFIAALLHSCIAVAALANYCIAALLHWSIAMLLHCCVAALKHCYIAALARCYIAALLY